MNFVYKSVDANGQIYSGTIEAPSESDAVNAIRGRQQRLIKLSAEEEKARDVDLPFFKKKVKVSDLTMFCKQLATMLQAGIPVSRALDMQAQQTVNKTLQDVLVKVSSSIKQGVPLSRAMKQFPDVFPALLLNMIEAGELTGKLDEVLAQMHEHYSKENKINNKVKGAMVYPLVLALLTVGVIIIMLVFVMPMFVEMFASANSKLPLPTRVMVGLSNSLRGYWYIYIAVVSGVVYGVKRYIGSDEGRRVYDQSKLKMPVMSGLMSQIITARFTRTLSTLLSSGVSIIKALESATELTNNVVVMESMDGVINDVKKGIPVSSLLRRVPVFPPLMVSMMSIGEETGSIDDMLAKTADYYDEELESAIGKLVALLEPLMIVFMGLAVGGILLAMYLPMMDMFDKVQL